MNKPGFKLGVVGLGGLGHMGVKLGKAFGCHVTVISTSESKRKEATERLGADAFLVSRNKEEVDKVGGILPSYTQQCIQFVSICSQLVHACPFIMYHIGCRISRWHH